MKQYLLFCVDQYEPNGGWNDFIGDFDSIEEAIKNKTTMWFHIVDRYTKKIVACSSLWITDYTNNPDIQIINVE